MKFPRLKFPRPSLRAIKIRLPAPRAIRRPRFTSALPGKMRKGAALYLGAGAAVLVGLGALGWLVVWPALRPPQAPAAPAPEQTAAVAPAEAPVANVAVRQPGDRRDSNVEKPQDAAGNSPPAPVEGQATARPEQNPPTQQVAAPAPPPPASEPELLVRRLQVVQERIAGGDPDSYAELPRLLRSIAQSFAALPPETWKQKQNARALALYLLSGGNSAIGRKILNARQIAPSEEALAKGAIAYLDGIDCAERDALLTLDPRALDPALGAQVAFVQSILLASFDRQKAIEKLDLARLLAPGGLVEEAALRREIGLLGETVDFGKFAAMSRQYWTRFRRSPYAENFLRQFMGAVARVSALIKIEQWAELDEFINSEAPETRRALYLVMAKTAAVAGNSAFAYLCAQRAIELSAPDSPERQRALLYRAAAEVADANSAQSQDLLRDIERGKLPSADQPLFDATALVSARVFRAPEKELASPPRDARVAGDDAAARAEAGLKDADDAIEDARKSMERKGR